MKSMTGYAFIESVRGETAVSVEIKGYNNRFLEVSVQLPAQMSAVEGRVRELAARKCARGRVEVHIRIKGACGFTALGVNEDAAAQYIRAFETLARSLGTEEKMTARDLMHFDGVIEINTAHISIDDSWAIIHPVLVSALTQFDKEKKREGKHTEQDILSAFTKMEDAVKKIAEAVPQENERLKNTVFSRFAEIAGTVIDENRLLAETALLVMKYTISEEISRLMAHFSEFWAEIKAVKTGGSPGKKLDFLCQEINREINTIGSKSQAVEIIKQVVEIKEHLENIREQLRNVE